VEVGGITILSLFQFELIPSQWLPEELNTSSSYFRENAGQPRRPAGVSKQPLISNVLHDVVISSHCVYRVRRCLELGVPGRRPLLVPRRNLHQLQRCKVAQTNYICTWSCNWRHAQFKFWAKYKNYCSAKCDDDRWYTEQWWEHIY